MLVNEYTTFYAKLPVNQSTACDHASFDFADKLEATIIQNQCLQSSASPYACELSQSFIKNLFQVKTVDSIRYAAIRIEFRYTCGLYSK